MSLHSWLQNLTSVRARQRKHNRRLDRGKIFRLSLETLEDRRLLAFDPIASYPVDTSPQAVVTGDFNTPDSSAPYESNNTYY